MKKLLTHVALVLLTVCLVIGCGRHHYPQSLLTADSLAEVRPDSSLKMLEAMAGEMATAPTTDQMYYRLLRIKASDKCDRLQPDTFEITQIVDYYEQAGDSLLPAAYYYAGRTYYDLHDMPQALGYYQKAVDAICDRQTRPFLLLKEVCYSQMGYIFMYQKLYEQAKEMHIKEISTAQQINDTLGLSYGYRDLGFIYSELENYKDAINMLKMALFKAHSSNNDKLEFAIKSYLANTYRHLGDYDSALYYLRPVLEHVNLLSKSSVYSNAAKIYYDKGKIDSALYYFHQLELVGGVYAKENAYKHLLQDAIIRKEFVDVSNYYHNYLLYSDSVKKITQTEVIAKISSQYRFQKKEDEKHQLEADKARQLFLFIILSLIAVTIIAALMVVLLIYRKKQAIQAERYENLQRIKEEDYKKSMEYIEANKQRIGELEKQLISTSQDNIDLKRQLEREKERLITSNRIAKIGIEQKDMSIAIVRDSHIYRHLISMANHEHPSEKDWNNLESLLNQECDNFCDKLKTLCKLKPIAYRISLLIKIGIEPSQMAQLLNTSKQNISTTKSRLYREIFGKKGGAKDWDEFVKSI